MTHTALLVKLCFYVPQLVQEGKVPLKSARLFLDLSDKVRKVLESYFQLDTSLYFSYSHLVCRSAIHEKQENRKDLSHPVHVDNCVLVSELKECKKEPPAYTHRDYSAILYLNDDFEGGEFIFTELDAKTVTAEVHPRCGRVVGFGAGKENPHGVRAITKGQRCAMALWFTLDPTHEEKERIQALDMLTMFSTRVDSEFSHKKTRDSFESGPAPLHADVVSTDKQEEILDILSDTNAGKSTDQLKGMAKKIGTTKSPGKAKAPPKPKTEGGEQTKETPATKDATVKQKVKQDDRKGAIPAVNKTIRDVSKKNSTSASDFDGGKDEL
ncbi:prolyl 3-hydroxylase 1 [Fundulus heteroclitus]|uniref:prolyl 3-hydroxylase 1 n=1 Tax=Fundulus heteroclitus TaxID=8078 RepID=UPI00165A3554|nr:prolyl 3-hydroxylase 1 [Fundulus heteroclitus]